MKQKLLGMMLLSVFSLFPIQKAQATGPSDLEPRGIFTVVIDPGHGGIDSGAVNEWLGIFEKDLNLEVARAAHARLLELGVHAVMTREGDDYMEIVERTDLAKSIHADLLVSIHHDTDQDWGDGAHLIHSIHEGPSLNLAEEIGAAIVSQTGQELRSFSPYWFQSGMFEGEKDDYYGILRRSTMPAVIVEAAYLNAHNIQAVDTPEKRALMGRAIADGIYAAIRRDFTGIVTYKGIETHYDPKTNTRLVEVEAVMGN
ncbi:MAG: N-acetylmuramoyl-L-alanine amidase [Turicibacter sp.]|nr:N-acetylmuramoyl-L-alanine amidase [Turicibacter sp.]